MQFILSANDRITFAFTPGHRLSFVAEREVKASHYQCGEKINVISTGN
jgi:hypothetical protein